MDLDAVGGGRVLLAGAGREHLRREAARGLLRVGGRRRTSGGRREVAGVRRAAGWGGGGGVTGVVAADGGVSLGGALVSPLRSHARAGEQEQQADGSLTIRPRVRWALVMAPLYHGRAGRGSRWAGPVGVSRRFAARWVFSTSRASIACSTPAARSAARATLAFATYVDGLLPIMGGEPVGRLTWVYDGEKFVDGVYEVACAACKEVLFAADVCPRCHAPGGLARALADAQPLAGAVGLPVVRRRAAALRRVRPGARRLRGQAGREGAQRRPSCTRTAFTAIAPTAATAAPWPSATDACPLCEAPAPLRARPG